MYLSFSRMSVRATHAPTLTGTSCIQNGVFCMADRREKTYITHVGLSSDVSQ